MTEETQDNIIFVGEKTFMNYVTAVVMQVTTKDAKQVILKARGKFISKAVDIAEVATKRFLDGQLEVKNISSGSEDFKNAEGRDIRVSTIEIALGKREVTQ